MSNDEYYRVRISAHTRHGRTALHTFASPLRIDGKTTEAPSIWFVDDPPSHRQMPEFSRARHPASNRQSDPQNLYGPPLRRPAGEAQVRYEVLETGRINLGGGCDPTGLTLAVVLNALRSGGRIEVDLADLKVVFSQLGSRITKLDGLPETQRRHAEAALYTEILRRCTKV